MHELLQNSDHQSTYTAEPGQEQAHSGMEKREGSGLMGMMGGGKKNKGALALLLDDEEKDRKEKKKDKEEGDKKQDTKKKKDVRDFLSGTEKGKKKEGETEAPGDRKNLKDKVRSGDKLKKEVPGKDQDEEKTKKKTDKDKGARGKDKGPVKDEKKDEEKTLSGLENQKKEGGLGLGPVSDKTTGDKTALTNTPDTDKTTADKITTGDKTVSDKTISDKTGGGETVELKTTGDPISTDKTAGDETAYDMTGGDKTTTASSTTDVTGTTTTTPVTTTPVNVNTGTVKETEETGGEEKEGELKEPGTEGKDVIGGDGTGDEKEEKEGEEKGEKKEKREIKEGEILTLDELMEMDTPPEINEEEKEEGEEVTEDSKNKVSAIERAQAGIESVNASYKAETEKIRTDTTKIKNGLRNHAASVKASNRKLVETERASVKGKFSDLRKQYKTDFTATRNFINDLFIKKVKEADNEGRHGEGLVIDAFNNFRTDVSNAVNDSAEGAGGLGDKYVKKLEDGVNAQVDLVEEKRVRKCNSLPNTERGDAQRDAVNDAAYATTAKLFESTPDAIEAIEDSLNPLPDQFVEEGEKALEGIDDQETQMRAKVLAQPATTKKDLLSAKNEALKQVDEMEKKAEALLKQQEKTILKNLDDQAMKSDSLVDKGLKDSLVAIDAGVTDVQKILKEKHAEAVSLLSQVDDTSDSTRVDSFVQQMNETFASIAASSLEAMNVTADERKPVISSTRKMVAQGLKSVSKGLDATIKKLILSNQAGLAALKKGTKEQMDKVIKTLADANLDTEKQVKLKLNEALVELKTGFKKSLDDTETEISKAVEEALDKNTPILDEVDAKLDEAADDAGWSYDHPFWSAVWTGLQIFAGIFVGLLKLAAFVLIGLLVAIGLGLSGIAALIVGIVVLIGFIVYAAYQHYKANPEKGWGNALWEGTLDVTGVNSMIYACTAEGLSPYERAEMFTTGAGQLVLTFFGARIMKGVVPRFQAVFPNIKPGFIIRGFKKMVPTYTKPTTTTTKPTLTEKPTISEKPVNEKLSTTEEVPNIANKESGGVNRIYSSRELIRRSQEPGPYHNFPETFDDLIFRTGTKEIVPNFYTKPKTGLTNTNITYKLQGSVNGREGIFEIGVRPSISGNTEVIIHRFFRPFPSVK